MGNNFLSFGDSAALIRNTVKPEDSNGARYIGLEHIEQGTLHLNGYGSANDVSSAKSQFKAGDILFGKLKPYFRKVVRAPFDGVCSTDIWVVRAKDGIDQGFLYYWMASQEFVNFSMQGSEGTKMPRAKWEHVSRHKIPYFTLPEQRAIAHILGSLDDKIELNRQMNRTLEKMAGAIFKSWFVDFDPVRAKADLPAGRQEAAPKARPGVWFVYAIECEGGSIYIGHTEDVQRRFDEHLSGKGAEWTKTHRPIRIAYWEELPTQKAAIAREKKLKTGAGREWLKAEICKRDLLSPGLPKEIADLFPNSFEDSELGPIPKGWRVKTLYDLFDLIGGGTPKTSVPEYWGGTIPWFSVVDAPSVSDVFVIDTEKHITELGVKKSSTKILPLGTTIISARGTVGKCAVVGVPMAMNQSCYGVRGKNGIADGFVYYTIREQVADLQRSGHGSVFNTITKETFKSIRIPFASPQLTQAFDNRISPFFAKIRYNLFESKTLACLRDTLLPKLISGELRVPDAEKFIEEAGV